MNVLVTGAAGFIGKRIIQQLDTLGYNVLALARCSKPIDVNTSENVRWIENDIAEDGLQSVDITNVDTVIHLAGATLGAGENAWKFLMANEATTLRLLQGCAKNINKLVFASSQVVYGDVNHKAVTEDFALQSVESAYACSKLNSENWLRWFQHKYKGRYLSLRFSGFVEGGGIIDYIIYQALRDQPIELFTKGVVCRDYLPIDKGVEALLAAFNYKGNEDYISINIGSGQILSSLELAKLICKEVGSSSEILTSDLPAPQGDFIFDISKARRLLNFSPGDLSVAVKNYAQKKKAYFVMDEANA